METNLNSRRNFLSKSLKGAVLVGAGATFAGSLLEPIAALAQTSNAALQAKIAQLLFFNFAQGFAKPRYALGTASLQTSQLALTKASNAEVKLFAKFEAAEQETMGKILKDMGTTVPAPSAEGTALLTKLQSLSGVASTKLLCRVRWKLTKNCIPQ